MTHRFRNGTSVEFICCLLCLYSKIIAECFNITLPVTCSLLDSVCMYTCLGEFQSHGVIFEITALYPLLSMSLQYTM